MSRSKFRQLEQIANSQNYNDGYAEAHSVSVAEPGSLDFSIEYDLNILRTQLKQLKGSANWFDSIDSSSADGYTLAALKARLDNMETFVGAADGTDSTPDYASYLNYNDNVSLETAIAALDLYLGNIKGGFVGTRILSGMTDGYSALQRLDEGYASVQDELDRVESAIGGVISASGNYVAHSETNYINGNTTITQDLLDLDAAIASVASNTSSGYQAEDGYLQAFIGKSANGSEMPDYSSSVIVSDGTSLETAIGALDAYVSNNANYTLQKIYENDVDGSDAVITTNAADGAVKIAGDQKLWVSATEGLDIDTKLDFDGSVFDVQMSASNGFSIDGAGASNVSVAGANLTLSTTTSGDVIVAAAATLNMDAATVEIDATSGFSIDGVTASNLSTSNGNLTVAAGGVGADLIMSAVDKVDMDAATVEIDASGAISLGAGAANSDFSVAGAKLTLQTTGSGNVEINAASVLDMNATGAATLDAAGITMTSSGSNDVTVVSGAKITFDDATLSAAVAMTRGSSAVSGWSAGITEAYGESATFANLGIVEAINELGDGYQSLSNEMDAFTLQRAYNQGLAATPDIQLVNDGSFEIVLGTGGSEFKVSNNAGSNTLKVADGYVLIDGYLSVTGNTVQVNSTVTDSDHLLLSPGLSSTVALKLEPSVAAGVYNANLMEMYDGYQGALVVSVDEDGDAYFAKSVEIDGILNVDGSIDADISSMDVDASGAITLDAAAASNFSVSNNTLSFATTGNFEMDLTSGGALDMNASGAATLDAASVALTSTGGDISASASGDITLTAGDDIEFLDLALSASVAMTRGASNSVGSWSTGVGDAYGSAASFSNLGIVEAINALGDGYAALQNEVDNIEGSLGLAVDGDGGWLGFDEAYGIVATAVTFTDAIERIVDAYDSNVVEINNIEAAAGLNANGTFSAHTGTNYLNAATTMKQVDGILDTNLKRVEDGYAAEDGFLRSFIGKSAIGSEMPDYSSSVIVSDGTSLETAIGALDAYVSNNANYTLQKIYENDVDGSDASITTNSTDGYVVIAGSEGLKVTAAKGMLVDNLLDLNGSVDADVSTFDIDASGAFTLDSLSFSLDSTSASNMSVTGAALTVSTLTSGDLNLTAASNMRLKDTRSAATGAGDGSFALSTAATPLGFGGADFSSVVRSLAGVGAGVELGLVNAINAIGASSSTIEKAVYVIGASDSRLFDSDKTLKLNAGSGPDRGSLELTSSDGYGVDFRPGRDIEVYVNGQLMLPDASQKTAGSAATDDYFLASDDITKITFAFALVEGDVVVVKNLKPAPGEDVSTGWTLIV